MSPDTVWSNLLAPAPFDQVELERSFAMAESRTPASSRRAEGASAGFGPVGEATNAPERKRIRVLDDRTSQLLAIAFNRLPSPERLAAVLDTLKDFPDGLPAEAVLALNSAVSEQREAIEQLKLLEVTEADLSQLDVPERYLWILGRSPSYPTKLACGALIVGSGRELGDLRKAGLKVGTCCKALQSSNLVAKCISTSLAVGNIMNRGTARSDARALILPEALLKLDELRGNVSGGDSSVEVRGPSLLDFVVQAIVDEGNSPEPASLRDEAEELRIKARAAQSVSLEEAERTCQKVCAEASRAWRSLGEMNAATHATCLTDRVRQICDEAQTATRLVNGAKSELDKTQQWSSAKRQPKSEEWFRGWCQFFEQLSQSLARVRPRSMPVAQAQALRGEHVPESGALVAVPSKAPAGAMREDMKSVAPPAVAGLAREPIKEVPLNVLQNSSVAADLVQQPVKRASSKPLLFDEDARIEDLIATRDRAQAGSKNTCAFNDKENAVPV